MIRQRRKNINLRILFYPIFILFSLNLNAQDTVQVAFEIIKSCDNEVTTINLSEPIAPNTHFLWKVVKADIEPEQLFTSPEVEPVFILNPGNYDIILSGWNDVNGIMDYDTNSITVAESNTFEILSSDVIICSKSFSLHSVNSQNFVSCHWEISSEDYIVQKTGVDQFELVIDWGKAPVTQEIQLKATLTDEQGCSHYKSTELLLLPNEIPDAIKIIRKNKQSNILVCITNENNNIADSTLIYQWGYSKLQNGEIEGTKESIYPYLNYDSIFNHQLDTSNYAYFVNVRKRGFYICKETLYYDLLPETKWDNFPEESNNNVLKIYPNPSNGSFSLSAKVREGGDYQVLVVNQFGNCIYKTHIPAVKSGETLNVNLNLKSPPKGIYILTFSNLNSTSYQYEKIIIN